MLSPVCTLFLVSGALVLGTHGTLHREPAPSTPQSQSEATTDEGDSDDDDSELCHNLQMRQCNGTMSCQHDKDKQCVNSDTFSCSAPTNTFNCSAPTNTFNCSATLRTLHAGSQYSLSVLMSSEGSINICAPEGLAVGIQSKGVARCHGTLPDTDIESWRHVPVIVHVNVSQPDAWCLYTTQCYFDDIVIPGPPCNITAKMKDSDLLVQWSAPDTRFIKGPSCFEHQLQINDQIKNITNGARNYLERNANPKLVHQVRMRTKVAKSCSNNILWGDWSSLIAVGLSATEEPQPRPLNLWAIVCITLGIPMILLAFLLLVRPQRVYKHLFPPIPHPSMKIKHLLERDDLVQFTTSTPQHLERITVVEEVGETLVTSDPQASHMT